MSGFFCWNVSIIFLVISSSTPVCESHHSTVAWAAPPAAGAAVAPPAAAPAAVGAVPPPVGAAAPPHAARSDAPAIPAMPCRNLRRLTAGFSGWVPMCVLLQIHLSHSITEAEMQHCVFGGCASHLLAKRPTEMTIAVRLRG